MDQNVQSRLPAMSGREAALRVLLDVSENNAYANISIKRIFGAHSISPEDRRLATEIAYGTLNWQMKLDFYIKPYLRSAIKEQPITEILRMSVYQILYLDRVPVWSVVDEAVKLTYALGFGQGLAGFVNSILRKVADQKDNLPQPDRRENAVVWMAVEYSMPEWIIRLWNGQLGEEATLALLQQPQPKNVCIYANPMKMTPDELAALLTEREQQYQRGRIWPEAFLVEGLGDVAQDEAFTSGAYHIQGQASLWAASLVGAKPGMKVLDACAAPGGKTLFMGCSTQDECEIDAWDIHQHRVGLIQAALHRSGLKKVTPRVRDARELEKNEETYDAVLLDAPCSGLGTVLNRPELKYRMTRADIAAMGAEQIRLLNTCARRVRVGGVLVYATCTINHEENRDRVAAFLREWPEFRLDMPAELLPPGVDTARIDNGLQLLPSTDGCDGFFAARLVRRV